MNDPNWIALILLFGGMISVLGIGLWATLRKNEGQDE